MLWWYWIIGGLALAAIELATPGGFFVIFFSIAAIVVGLLDVGGTRPGRLAAMAALLRGGRSPVLGSFGSRCWTAWAWAGQRQMDTLVGEVAIATSNIQPGEHGRAELRGAGWSARNVDTATLAIGQRCRVVAVQGLMLDLRQE